MGCKLHWTCVFSKLGEQKRTERGLSSPSKLLSLRHKSLNKRSMGGNCKYFRLMLPTTDCYLLMFVRKKMGKGSKICELPLCKMTGSCFGPCWMLSACFPGGPVVLRGFPEFTLPSFGLPNLYFIYCCRHVSLL